MESDVKEEDLTTSAQGRRGRRDDHSDGKEENHSNHGQGYRSWSRSGRQGYPHCSYVEENNKVSTATMELEVKEKEGGNN